MFWIKLIPKNVIEQVATAIVSRKPSINKRINIRLFGLWLYTNLDINFINFIMIILKVIPYKMLKDYFLMKWFIVLVFQRMVLLFSGQEINQ